MDHVQCTAGKILGKGIKGNIITYKRERERESQMEAARERERERESNTHLPTRNLSRPVGE